MINLAERPVNLVLGRGPEFWAVREFEEVDAYLVAGVAGLFMVTDPLDYQLELGISPHLVGFAGLVIDDMEHTGAFTFLGAVYPAHQFEILDPDGMFKPGHQIFGLFFKE